MTASNGNRIAAGVERCRRRIKNKVASVQLPWVRTLALKPLRSARVFVELPASSPGTWRAYEFRYTSDRKSPSIFYLDQWLEALEKTSAQAKRAEQIVQHVRELVRRHEPQLAACNVNKLISDAASLIEINAEKNGVDLRLELASKLPVVFADAAMLEQALLNITRNAGRGTTFHLALPARQA
jgi:signal transduction histidine kinase